jgi:hypothetical protein
MPDGRIPKQLINTSQRDTDPLASTGKDGGWNRLKTIHEEGDEASSTYRLCSF